MIALRKGGAREGKKDTSGLAAITWRKGRIGYKKRTSLWDIKLNVNVTTMQAHARVLSIDRCAGLSVAPLSADLVVDSPGLGKDDCGVSRRVCHTPQTANGSAVVNKSGKPSVK